MVIVASGCTPGGDGNEGQGDETSLEKSYSIGSGLEILSFSSSDSHLYPGQRAVMILRMRNHHIEEINVDQMEPYNLGPLELVDSDDSWEERCTPSDIPPAQYGDSPIIECRWRVRAPDDLGDFESKVISPRLQLRYDSVLSNKRNPLKLQFKDYTSIDSPSEISRTYTNKEIEVQAVVENPAPVEGTTMGLKFRNAGDGKLIPLSEGSESNTYYEVEPSPGSVFQDCSPSFDVQSPISTEIETSCEIMAPSGESVARNLVFATSYKYQRSPSLDIEVVNDQ